MFVDFLVQPVDRQTNDTCLFSAPGHQEPKEGLPSPSSASASETRIKESRIMRGAFYTSTFSPASASSIISSLKC